jgi:hypothetical protein
MRWWIHAGPECQGHGQRSRGDRMWTGGWWGRTAHRHQPPRTDGGAAARHMQPGRREEGESISHMLVFLLSI